MGRLKPQPFREVKRRLEAAGFVEAAEKGSQVKFVGRPAGNVDTVKVPPHASSTSMTIGDSELLRCLMAARMS